MVRPTLPPGGPPFQTATSREIIRRSIARYHGSTRLYPHATPSTATVLTGPGFPYQPVPALPARFWLAVPPLSRSFYHNEPGKDMRWKGGGLGIQETLYPMEAFDGDLESYYLTYGPRRDTETITLVLDKPDTFDHVQAITGFPNGDLILRQGALDVSEDLRVWREVAPFHNGVAEAKLNGEPVRAVRLRSTVSQDMYDWLAVREIVLEKNGESTLKRIAQWSG